jgi:DNA-binding transcriptional regulator YiaG
MKKGEAAWGRMPDEGSFDFSSESVLTDFVNAVPICHNSCLKMPNPTWSSAAAMRVRREQLGLSQADLAKALDVSKSLQPY